MVLSRGVRFTVIKCGAEHVSPASEWMNLSQPESVFILDGRSGLGPEGKSSKWRPAIGQFMVELKATAISTPVVPWYRLATCQRDNPDTLPSEPEDQPTSTPSTYFRSTSVSIFLCCAPSVSTATAWTKTCRLAWNSTAPPPAYVPSEATARLPSFAPFKNWVRSSLLNMLRVTYSLGWILPT